VAWFRAMGVDQVAYHEATVLGREDDHPGQALDYYGSRGETPLRWGGAGAARLGLEGEVTPKAYRWAFGPGGFQDPLTGQQLVRTTRPGFELVISAHKSLSLLGVAGRADDMHTILDAETAGTMGYLDTWAQTRGGRRGRASIATPTSGLVYAVTRHGTSRMGDPSLHDHVLIANVCEMRDSKGGYKALYSARLRDLVEAAAMVGRLRSATTAIKLGYAIEIDHGRSGRARDWRIVGIPAEVCEIFPSAPTRSPSTSRRWATRATGPATSPPAATGRSSGAPAPTSSWVVGSPSSRLTAGPSIGWPHHWIGLAAVARGSLAR
jgi:conjugative relaxase-like TrwC/TraI family protein